MVENLVGIELSYINTKHPDFSEAGLIHRVFSGDELPVASKSRSSSANRNGTMAPLGDGVRQQLIRRSFFV